jgi:hypothetical protein
MADTLRHKNSLSRLVFVSWAQMAGVSVEPHPCADAVERRNHTWALRFGLIDHKSSSRLARIGCGSFAAHTYRTATPPVVELGANLITWLYLFDDAYGEGRRGASAARMRQRFDELEHMVRTGAAPADSPFARALADLVTRLTARVGDDWRHRFADSLARYFAGCLLELPYRRERRTPTATEYRALRRWSVGGLPVFDLIELTLPAPLSPAMASAPELSRLREAAAELCAWVNDIFSYHKESSDDDSLNLVAVLMGDRKLTLPRAFAAAAELYNDDRRAFLALRDAFCARPDVDDVARAYVDGLVAWVHGNHAWTQTSQRYRELDSLARRHPQGDLT